MADLQGYNLLENPCVAVEYSATDEEAQSWTALGSRYDAHACGRLFDIVENCDAPPPDQLEPPLEAAAPGYKVTPFGLLERQQTTTTCSPDDIAGVERALECATEHLVSDVLWNGGANMQALNPDWDQEMYLTHADIATVTTPPGEPTNDWTFEGALAQLIEQAYARHPELRCCSIIHMGMRAGLALSGPIKRLGLNVVISAAYPSFEMAITGPIEIRLGRIDANINMASVPSDNKVWVSASRFAAFAFDPCLALRMDYT